MEAHGLPTPALSRQRLCHNRYPRGEAVGFQSFRMRVIYIMGNRRLYDNKCIHMLGTPESERLKVPAPNLFYPTASPPFPSVGFFTLRHSLSRERGTHYYHVSCLPAPPSVGTGAGRQGRPLSMAHY